MRINSENNTMDMEARDIDYILPAYIRSYLYYNKNKMPDKIIFPMFASVEITGDDRQVHKVPIEWIPEISPAAQDISKNGADVVEVTPAQEAKMDEKDEEIKRLKGELEAATAVVTLTERGTEKQPDTKEEVLVHHVNKVASPTPSKQEPEIPAPLEATGIGKDIPAARKAFTEPEPKKKPSPAKPPREPKQPPGGDIGAGQPLSGMQPRDSRDQKRTARDLLDEPNIDNAPEKEFEKEISRDDKGNPVIEDKPDATS